MSRRASTALTLCVLLVGLTVVVGVTADTGPVGDLSRVTTYVDAPDLDIEFDGVAPLVVAVLGAATLAWALGPWTAPPGARALVRLPVVRRRAPARSPPRR